MFNTCVLSVAVITTWIAMTGCNTHTREAAPDRATRAQECDRYLRERQLGVSIAEVSGKLGGVTFDSCEAGSSLYPYWTMRGHVGTMGVCLGAVAQGNVDNPLENLDKMLYVGHYILNDGAWTSTRWVYTDGLVRDSGNRPTH